MHIVKDENGNPCPHHAGQPCEAHCHGHEGGHCHGHEHGHAHEHGHGHGESETGDRNAALLKYMLDHNTHHASELDQMAAKLAAEGHSNAAEQIRRAVDEFQKGNMYLNLALTLVGETDN